MSEPNINLLRHNAKQILKANYDPDWKVVVRGNGEVELYNPHEDVWYCEGNLYEDSNTHAEWTRYWIRYGVERMVGPDVTFEEWRFHTKTGALDKLIELVEEDNGQQINLMDYGRHPARVIRVTCCEGKHFIEIMPRFVAKRDFNRLLKVQEGLKYRSTHCGMVDSW